MNLLLCCVQTRAHCVGVLRLCLWCLGAAFATSRPEGALDCDSSQPTPASWSLHTHHLATLGHSATLRALLGTLPTYWCMRVLFTCYRCITPAPPRAPAPGPNNALYIVFALIWNKGTIRRLQFSVGAPTGGCLLLRHDCVPGNGICALSCGCPV